MKPPLAGAVDELSACCSGRRCRGLREGRSDSEQATMHKSWFGLLVLAVAAMTAAAAMAAQQSDFKLSSAEWQMRQKTNEGVIRIIADDVDSTSFRAAAEVSSVLNGLEGMRVIPVVGRGSVSNINDLLFVKEIDLAVVQQDVLDQLRSTRAIPALERRVNYVTKLYNEEVH